MLLGRPPSEVRALPVSDLHQLAAYWAEEPWGPWRDNAHAGVIASAVENLYVKKGGKRRTFDDHMLKSRKTGVQARGRALVGFLKSIAVRKKKP